MMSLLVALVLSSCMIPSAHGLLQHHGRFRHAPSRRSSASAEGLIQGKSLSIPEFNFDVASWEVGSVVDCRALSEAMHSFGGFPSTILVREEMKTTWSIVVDGITKKESRWAIIGSHGVGKSVLTVLLCFYLAQDRPVFFARKMNGQGETFKGQAAICVQPGGGAMAYPVIPSDKVDLELIMQQFGTQLPASSEKRILVVLDGWDQAEMVGDLQRGFGGFHILATPDYRSKSGDTRHVVLHPAWHDDDLALLWEQCRPRAEGFPTFKEQLYYSGGSARDLLRPTDDVRNLIYEIVWSLDKAACDRLGTTAGADDLRRCYLLNNSAKAPLEPRKWKYVVDSAYSLSRLSDIASLEVYEKALAIAPNCGPVHHDLMFEALVHQLFCVPNVRITFHMRPDTQHGVPAAAYESIALDTTMLTECSGMDEATAMDRLGNQRIDAKRGKYWHPDFPGFPVIDAVLFAPATQTVYYIQLTAAKEEDFNCEKLAAIHEVTKNALEKSIGAEGWKLYVMS